MANMMQFDLVSPERRLVSVEAEEVYLPATEGDMTVMPLHAPLITTLRPGLINAKTAEGEKSYFVSGGFADIGPDKISVLAEQAMPKEDMTREIYDKVIKEAEENLNKARETFVDEPGAVDDAAKLLADMVAMGDHIRIE